MIEDIKKKIQQMIEKQDLQKQKILKEKKDVKIRCTV